MESDGSSQQPGPGVDSTPMGESRGALLVIIGEPFSEDHKQLILADITKGFKCWGCEDIDINEELAHIAARADIGEEGPEGERILRYRSDYLAVEILINPQCHTLTQSLKVFLGSPTRYKHLVHAGHYFSGSGAWVLQDDTYTVAKMAQMFKDHDIENSMKQHPGTTLVLHSPDEWKSLPGMVTCKELKIQINPEGKHANLHGALQFAAYVSNFVKPLNLPELLQVTDYVGSLKFIKPTMYIFPGCEGDSALFVINGFNLLVNGGYRRKPCFWDISRHLDRIDAMLLTHLGTDNLFGVSSMLQRKALGNIHPQLGYLYMNCGEKLPSPVENGQKEPSLCVNLAEEGSKLVGYAKQTGVVPHACVRQTTGQQIAPINLYHKVGYGSLDMYILNPVSDAKELKDFYQQWNKHVADFGVSQNIPLPSMLSVCALLVWKPANPNEKINRIFFPGNAPQHKVVEGLEKLKHLDFLKHPSCSAKDLQAKPAKKAAPAGRPSLGGKAPARPQSSRTEAPKPAAEKKEPPSKGKTDLNRTFESKPRNGTPESKTSAAALKKPATAKASKPPQNDIKAKPEKEARPTSARKETPKKETPTKKSPTHGAKKPEPANGTKAAKTSAKGKVEPKTNDVKKTKQTAEVEKPVDEVKPAENSLIDISPMEPEPVQPETTRESGGISESPDDLPEPNSYSAAPASTAPLDPFEMLNTKPSVQDTQQDMFQGDVLVPDVNGQTDFSGFDDMTEKPQSLPEPVAFSPQEPDLIPESEPVKEVSPVPDPNLGNLPDPDVVPASKGDVDDVLEREVEKPMAAPDELVEEKVEEAEKHEDEEMKEDTKEEGTSESRSPILSPVEPDTKSDALDEHEHEADEEELSPDEADSQGDVAELTNSQVDEDNPAELSGVSPLGYENEGFVDSLNEGRQEEEDTKQEKQKEPNGEEMGLQDSPDEEDVDEDMEAEKQEDEDEEEDDDDDEGIEEGEEVSKDTKDGSNIPEAFEKDDTPDPPELKDPHDDIVPQSTMNIDPRDQYVVKDQPLDSINEEAEEGDGNFNMRMEGGLNPFNGLDQAQIPSAVQGKQQFQDPFSVGGPGQGFTFGHVGQTSPSQHPYSRQIPCQEGYDPYDDEEDGEMEKQEFNPETVWGKPMGLPSPLPPEDEAQSGPHKKTEANGKAADKTKKTPGAAKGTTTTVKKTTSSTTTTKVSEKEKASKTAMSKAKTTVTKTETTGDKLNTTRVESTTKTTTRPRPATAGGVSEPKTKPPHRPATATGVSHASKMPSLPPLTPFYLDLAYIPHHGDPAYCNVEYFKRVRARYYIYSTLTPNPSTLTALLEAKQTWEDKDLCVTVYPTYDNDTLRMWMALNEQKLHDAKIEVAASVSRCILQLQDSDTSCQALRLELADGAE